MIRGLLHESSRIFYALLMEMASTVCKAGKSIPAGAAFHATFGQTTPINLKLEQKVVAYISKRERERKK